MSILNIKSCVVGKMLTNSYLISSNNNYVLVDPGDNPTLLDNEFFGNNHSINIDCIIATHGHFDHVGGVGYFIKKYNSQFRIHPSDKKILKQANLYRKISGDTNFFEIPKIDFEILNEECLNFGEIKFKIHHLPGHSEGSIVLEIDNFIFSGDLLFINSLGRTDLPGGDPQKMQHSISYILNKFKGYQVLPGHGNSFILDSEKINFYKDLMRCK